MEGLERKVKGIYNGARKYVNFKLGLIGAALGGSVAFANNYEYGLTEGIEAFGKQAAYVFLVGGFNSKLCEKLSKRYNSKIASICAAATVPTLISGTGIYFMHSLLGTQDVMETTATFSSAALIVFTGLGVHFRRSYDKRGGR